MNGPNPTVTKVSALHTGSPIAMNVSPYVEEMVPIAHRHVARYPNLMYIPQTHDGLLTMAWGENPASISDLRLPVHTDHPLYVHDRMRFPLDPRTWTEYLKGFDFSFGTRIHGTIAAILAGTPALLLAHDSRTLELAQYHGIPHLQIKNVSPDIDALEMFEQADYSHFHARVPEVFARFTAFLEKNGLPHVYEPGNENPEFDERLTAAKLPPMVHTVTAPGDTGRREMMSRLQWLRQGQGVDQARKLHQFAPEFPLTAQPRVSQVQRLDKKVAASAQEVAELKKQLARAHERLDRQSQVIARLTEPKPTLLRRGRRFARRLATKGHGGAGAAAAPAREGTRAVQG